MRCVHLIPLAAGVSLAAMVPTLAHAQENPAPAGMGQTGAGQTGAAETSATVEESHVVRPPVLSGEGGSIGTGTVVVKNNEIVVTAARIDGQLDVPQKPIETMDEDDIAAYGVNSISDLIDAISPQTNSGRGRGDGRPVILVNGQRISSFREMRDIPPEAIRRLEIMPEEVALRFGYPANQRVVNIILKKKFAATTVSGEYNRPTEGGYDNYELETGLFKVAGPRRFNVTAKYTDTSMLTENERDVRQADGTQPGPGEPDPARYRSLAPADSEFTLNGTMTQGLGKDGFDGSFTTNGTFTHSVTNSWSGLNDSDANLPTQPDPLATRVETNEFQAGLGYSRMLGAWNFNVTNDGSYTITETDSDQRRSESGVVPGDGVDEALNRTATLSSLATLSGRPFAMPAGDANLTFKGGYDYTHSTSENSASNMDAMRLTRGDLSGGLNLALPLTSRSRDVLGAVGDITLNLSGGLDHLSDFGTLYNWSGGVTWAPTGKLSFQASYIVEEAAPTLTQLGAPVVQTYNVTVYDFTNNQTALVTVTSGGNPDLVKEKQRDIKLSATWQLPFMQRSNLLVEYFHNRSNDVSEAFPMFTPAVEAAFPGRVTRDAEGNLIALDRRPVTFEQETSSRIRWGLNLSGNIGPQQQGGPGGFGGPPPGGPPPGGSGGGSGGSGSHGGSGGGGGSGGPPSMMGGRGPQGARWNFSIYHTWRFTDRVKLADGVPVLDQLNGDALTAGGVPRHVIEAEGGVFVNGYGLRLKGEWDAPSTVNGTGAPDSSDLRFGSTFELNLRVFADIGRNAELVKKVPFFKGMRVSFVADNLLNSRQKVTDDNGVVPIAYQPAYRNPQGRVIGIDLRKMF
ncbi:TonB-dependent receptor [Novosphingobium sp. BL-8H]|uniref:TonB-dependent receptor plug domain-containing protein n=1 Tax=Novosphingobium sp. BL-8H TaxID=3127640 RepID=UPI00375828CF